MFHRPFLIVLLLLLFTSGCVERTEGQKIANQPENADVEPLVESSTAFGFDMFNALAEIAPEENVITSPYSAAVFLAMLLNGADGDTRQAIGEVLHLQNLLDASINDKHHALAHMLTEENEDVELAVANSLWSREDYPFNDTFTGTIRDQYSAVVEEIDLGSQETADKIDQWVSDQTNERIDEIAADLGLPDANTVLVLLNAVYFLGNWTDPFDPDLTADGTFIRPDESEVEVPMMRRDDIFQYADLEGYQALRLTYGEDERFGMDFYLPEPGTDIHAFREFFDASTIEETHAALKESRVEIRVPKFELEYDTGEHLTEVLSDLGMGIAFGAGADFSSMSTASPWLDSVIQKTYLRVDEEGTEAAVVTGGDMVESMPPQFTLDRPFLFTITDSETGTILFLGQIADPS